MMLRNAICCIMNDPRYHHKWYSDVAMCEDMVVQLLDCTEVTTTLINKVIRTQLLNEATIKVTYVTKYLSIEIKRKK